MKGFEKSYALQQMLFCSSEYFWGMDLNAVANLRLFNVVLMLVVFSGDCFVWRAYGYDPLDPSGNITIRWDVLQESFDGTNDIMLSIINYQLFRHVELPGWKLSWAWQGDEVIWNILGAEATQQGNCSALSGGPLPHCCEKEPVIIDLLHGAPYNKQVANCCRGGVLSSTTQDVSNHLSAFQMHIGKASLYGLPAMPENFTLGLSGYTCGDPRQVQPTKFSEDLGRRTTQALATWNVICTYSQFLASPAPTCCVSLSAFYNKTIVSCPKCSCACRGQPGAKCIRAGELLPMLQLNRNEPPKPVVQCSNHMCPIKVHWHIKLSYKLYWRVKITVMNLNHVKNYSEWNLVVLHPNLRNVTRVFSFNYKPLNVYSNINDTGMFFGIKYYNDLLLQSGENGNVQTELLLDKVPRNFMFREGWAFPRKISFNGDECVMPSPDDYPRLPNTGNFHAPAVSSLILAMLLLVTLA